MEIRLYGADGYVRIAQSVLLGIQREDDGVCYTMSCGDGPVDTIQVVLRDDELKLGPEGEDPLEDGLGNGPDPEPEYRSRLIEALAIYAGYNRVTRNLGGHVTVYSALNGGEYVGWDPTNCLENFIELMYLLDDDQLAMVEDAVRRNPNWHYDERFLLDSCIAIATTSGIAP